MTCSWCGAALPAGQRRYCSAAHKQAAYRRRKALSRTLDDWQYELLTSKEAARLLARLVPPP